MIIEFVVCVLSILVQVVGNAMNFGVIWYKNNVHEMRQTLINRLIANQCLLSSLIITQVLNTNIAICIFGHFSVPLSDVSAVVMRALCICYIMNADIIVILRNVVVVIS